MTPPVAAELFEVLGPYAADIESGAVKPGSSSNSTSPALTFCENFYAQFFQNYLHKEIKNMTLASKKLAIELRLEQKASQAPVSTLRLITWFEKFCDEYSNWLGLGYGAGSDSEFANFHRYLETLLERTIAWGKDQHLADLEAAAQKALRLLQAARKIIV